MNNVSNLMAGKDAVNLYGEGEAAELIKASIKRAELFVMRFLRKFRMVISAVGSKAGGFYSSADPQHLNEAEQSVAQFLMRDLAYPPSKAAEMAGHIGFGGSQAVMEAITIASKSAGDVSVVVLGAASWLEHALLPHSYFGSRCPPSSFFLPVTVRISLQHSEAPFNPFLTWLPGDLFTYAVFCSTQNQGAACQMASHKCSNDLRLTIQKAEEMIRRFTKGARRIARARSRSFGG
jgi:hypothetical protein